MFTIHPIDDRIRELCTKAATADDSEIENDFLDLKTALREHAQAVQDTTS